MPNYISIDSPPRTGAESMQESYRIKVCELTNDEAEQYGELMKQAFIKHHKEHIAREQNKPT